MEFERWQFWLRDHIPCEIILNALEVAWDIKGVKIMFHKDHDKTTDTLCEDLQELSNNLSVNIFWSEYGFKTNVIVTYYGEDLPFERIDILSQRLAEEIQTDVATRNIFLEEYLYLFNVYMPSGGYWCGKLIGSIDGRDYFQLEIESWEDDSINDKIPFINRKTHHETIVIDKNISYGLLVKILERCWPISNCEVIDTKSYYDERILLKGEYGKNRSRYLGAKVYGDSVLIVDTYYIYKLSNQQREELCRSIAREINASVGIQSLFKCDDEDSYMMFSPKGDSWIGVWDIIEDNRYVIKKTTLSEHI